MSVYFVTLRQLGCFETMSCSTFGISRVWIGEISDPPQYLSRLAQRIATLGGSYRSKYEMTFETVRQETRHINFFANNKSKITKSNQEKEEQEEKEKEKEKEEEEDDGKKEEEEEELWIRSSSLNTINDGQNQRIVPKNCLSILQHSKHNESVFVLFDDHIISASNLLMTQFIDPFKLKKRTKAIYVNGECYKWGDFYIYFGQISLHTSPADFVIVEIEYQCLHSFNIGNSNKILQETFHWIITPISKIIVSSTKTKTVQTELEKSMDIDNNHNDHNDDDDNNDEAKDVFVELSNEKGEKIRWKSQPTVDFNKLDIDPRCNFDGRHLSALYCRAFSQIATE